MNRTKLVKCDNGQIQELKRVQTEQLKKMLDDRLIGRTVMSIPPRSGKSEMIGEILMNEAMNRPSVAKAISLIKELQSEIDSLRKKHWGAYSPKHTVLWWKRLGLSYKIDAIMLMPLAILALGLLFFMLMTAFDKHWIAGTALIYILSLAVWGIYRMFSSEI